MTSPLTQSARIVAEWRDRLTSEYGLNAGDEALETTLEGISDLPEMMAKVARDIREAEAQSEAVGKMQKEMAERAARLESKAARLRIQLAWAMAESGMKRIPADVLPEMTVTMREGKAPLIIEDETKVPSEFLRVTTTPDKTKIREFVIEAHLPCGSWAYLGNPKPTLTVRTR